METTIYTALDWQYQPHKVEIVGRVIESNPLANLYLCHYGKGWAVYYGLQIKYFKLLSQAAAEYEMCAAHASACLAF